MGYLYPCEGGPCGTTRLSSIRDGLEDWELFSALGGEKALPLLKRVVRSPTDWTEDAALLESVRRDAARMLMDAQKLTVVEVQSHYIFGLNVHVGTVVRRLFEQV